MFAVSKKVCKQNSLKKNMLANNKQKFKTQTKRNRRIESRLVSLDAEELIQQVCMRPVIYDRSLKGYRKSSLRKQCWKEISKALGSTEEECRKRWRSLRDSFTKHHKSVQRLGDAAPNKQCKWVFYDSMCFLIPHLDGVSYDLDKMLDEYGDFSEDARSINSESIVLNSANEELVENDQSMENTKETKDHREQVQENLQQSSVSVQATDYVSVASRNPQQSPMNFNDNVTTSTSFSRQHHNGNNHKFSSNTLFCGEMSGDNSGILLDSDENFLMSCASTLRRLTNKQNALARLKIQQILFDIEFGEKNS